MNTLLSPLRTLVALLLLMGSSLLQSQETAAGCPPEAELGPRLEQRLGQLRDTRERLVAFISGNQLADVPPASLFVVDLNNEAAVVGRVAELRAAHETPAQTIMEGERLLQCAAANEKFGAPLQTVVEVQWQVNELRLQFLALPQERRAALVNVQRAFVEQSEATQALEQERLSAKEAKQQARQSVAEAEELAKSARNSAMRELASQRALLEKAREDLAGTQMRLTGDLQTRTNYYQETAQKLSALAAILVTEQATELAALQSWERYNEAAVIWRELVERIFQRIADPASYEPLPQLPPKPEALLARLEGDEQAQQYAQAYGEAEAVSVCVRCGW